MKHQHSLRHRIYCERLRADVARERARGTNERIQQAKRANEDWVLGQVARFGAWMPGLLSRAEHNAVDRLVARGAIKYVTLRGYMRAGAWEFRGQK